MNEMTLKHVLCNTFVLLLISGCEGGASSGSAEESSSSSTVHVQDFQDELVTADELNPEVEEELKPYFDEFKQFLLDNNLKLSRRRLASLQKIAVEKPINRDGTYPKNVAGRCYETQKRFSNGTIGMETKIVVSPELAELLGLTSESPERLAIMIRYAFFHEAGHCLGGLAHTVESEPRLKLPITIMDPYFPAVATLSGLPWEDLLEELAATWRKRVEKL